MKLRNNSRISLMSFIFALDIVWFSMKLVLLIPSFSPQSKINRTLLDRPKKSMQAFLFIVNEFARISFSTVPKAKLSKVDSKDEILNVRFISILNVCVCLCLCLCVCVCVYVCLNLCVCDVVWCGVMWCSVMWCGVIWRVCVYLSNCMSVSLSVYLYLSICVSVFLCLCVSTNCCSMFVLFKVMFCTMSV